MHIKERYSGNHRALDMALRARRVKNRMLIPPDVSISAYTSNAFSFIVAGKTTYTSVLNYGNPEAIGDPTFVGRELVASPSRSTAPTTSTQVSQAGLQQVKLLPCGLVG